MNTHPARQLLPALSLALVLAGCAASTSNLSRTDDSTYTVIRQGKTAFNRDPEGLAEEAKSDAAKYCADHGKQLKVVSVEMEKPFFSTGYASAKVVFRALDAGDPDLADSSTIVTYNGRSRTPYATAPGAASRGPVAPAAVAAPAKKKSATDALYDDLMKLDDLRKRGILTDEEFQEQKKKLLEHTK